MDGLSGHAGRRMTVQDYPLCSNVDQKYIFISISREKKKQMPKSDAFGILWNTMKGQGLLEMGSGVGGYSSHTVFLCDG